MATKKDTQVRFLGGYAARRDLLGVLSYPVALDEHEVEHTRFFMTNGVKWGQRPFDMDIVSVVFDAAAQSKGWWLLGKRGQVIFLSPAGPAQEVIADAGTGPGRLGYLSSIRLIGGRLFACGYRRQVYERVNGVWEHRDAGIVLPKTTTGLSLNDLEGNPAGTLCAVGNDGEIAVSDGSQWSLVDSPTNAHLYAVCVDASGRFCAAGAGATAIRGDGAGFEVLCAGDPQIGPLWDIECYDGQLVVSATAGVFVVRDDGLQPFDPPLPAGTVGYKLTACEGRLWSIGTHQIFCFDGKAWQEWVCPDNAP